MPPTSEIEQHSIDYIRPEERHGTAWDLGPFWFASNQQLLTVVTGLLAVVLGLNLFWAIVAIVLGNLIGTIFMAYHSAQGPKLGMPQMIQSRAQFGFYGAFFLFLATFFLQFGFFAGSAALSGETLHALASGVSIPIAIILISIPILALAILGYDWIHRWQRIATVVFAIAFAIVTLQILTDLSSLPSRTMSTTSPDWATFMIVISIVVTYQLAWAPFVSDYSRYLPEGASVPQTFWWTYVGSALSCIWLEILGCLVTLIYPDLGTAEAFGVISGNWLLFIMSVSLVGAASLNLYGGMLALITMLNTWRPVGRSAALRIVGILITLAAGLIAALAGYDSFLANFEEFLLVLLFLFVPWTAVNLVDFYLIRQGNYDIGSFFAPQGQYGGWAWRGLVAYFGGLVVEIPFIDQTRYTGPLVDRVGGADISWILGILVSGVLYYVLCQLYPLPLAQPSSAETTTASLLPDHISQVSD
jgi:nucleobase:cation symporter-1, NCS1 family